MRNLTLSPGADQGLLEGGSGTSNRHVRRNFLPDGHKNHGGGGGKPPVDPPLISIM